MVQFKVISVKATPFTGNDGKALVSNRCFVSLEDGDIGAFKTMKPVKSGDTLDIGFRQKDGLVFSFVYAVNGKV